jgi:uncharacterized protein YwgA
MFLMAMEAKDYVGPNFYKFVPYLYGPYSVAIASDLNNMSKRGEVVADQSYQRISYVVAPEGARKAEALATAVDARVLEFLKRTVGWVKSQTFSGLLNSIYKKYPDYATQSIFKR